VSDRYIAPLLEAVLDRSREESGELAPQLVRDWTALEGWAAASRVVEVPPPEIEELVGALAGLTAADVTPYCTGSTPDECLRCLKVIRRFLGERLARGVPLFIDRE
jgi:hypothetical protein